MLMTIQCPECHSPLRVPGDAQGRSARCPLCQSKFRIPDLSGEVADTIVAWLHTDEDDSTPVKPTAESRSIGSAPSSKPSKKLPHLASAKPSTRRSSDIRKNPRWARKKAAAAQATPMTRESGARKISGGVSKLSSAMGGTGEASHLVLKEVGTLGVRLSFDSNLLNQVAFRASMPLRCVVTGRCLHCGQIENDVLLARPLAWIDNATGHLVDPLVLEHRHEIHVHRQHRPFDVMGMMQPIEEFSTPFNNPMPYYVSRDSAATANLRCETINSTQGISCELTIPSPAFALDWFARVNGVCNDQYAQLEAELVSLQAAAWCSVPDKVRGRLAAWFSFDTGEQFIAYFNDADFTSNDAGLAGIIVTDQRLLYCRYHAHGDVPFGGTGTLLPIDHGAYVELHYQGGERHRLMARLHREDVKELRQTLQDAGVPLLMSAVVPTPAEE